jgi:hypothetical protein
MRMISVIRFAVLLLTWLIGSISHAQMPIQASDIQFKSIFGQKLGDSDVYSLLGTGFFKAMRSEDVDTIIFSWLESHPKAQVIPVTAISLGAKRGQLIYVCIEDDNKNLNIALIRQGAFPGGVMIDAIDYLRATGMASKSEQLPRRIMPDDKYKAFLK